MPNNYDLHQGFTLVRTIITADAAVPPMLPHAFDELKDAGGLPIKPFGPPQAKWIIIRFFADVSGSAPVIHLLGQSASGPGFSKVFAGGNDTGKTVAHRSKPTDIIRTGTLTMSGSITPGWNPITGEPTADTTWYECSGFSAAFSDDGRVTEYPAAAAPGFQKMFRIDANGEDLFHVFCTDLGAATTVLVAMKMLA